MEAARVYLRARALGLGGVLLVNPVSQGLPYEQVAYLLRKLSELSSGETDRVNRRLLLENARLAARVALALAGLE